MPRLTDEDVEWIRKRARAGSPVDQYPYVAVLLAERDRLAAENADLRAKLSHYEAGRPTLYREPGGPTP